MNKPYITSDPAEIKEMCMYTFLANCEPDDIEFRRFALDPANLPRLTGDPKKIAEVAPFWKWTQADEKILVKILESRGYDVKYAKDAEPEEFYSNQADEIMIAALEKRGYTVKKPVDYSDLTKKELLELCTQAGIKTTGKESNAKLIEVLNGNT